MLTDYKTVEERTPQTISERKRIATRTITRTFSDATNQVSGVGTARKNKYQNIYSGANVNSDKPSEIQINKEQLSYQNKVFMDDNQKFLATGLRKRTDYGRQREFELNSDRINRT